LFLLHILAHISLDYRMFRAYFDHFLRHIIVHICRLFTAYLPKPSYNSIRDCFIYTNQIWHWKVQKSKNIHFSAVLRNDRVIRKLISNRECHFLKWLQVARQELTTHVDIWYKNKKCDTSIRRCLKKNWRTIKNYRKIIAVIQKIKPYDWKWWWMK
jgi:hypothetical protein